MMKKLLCLLAALIIGTSGVWAAITTPFVPTTGAYYSLKEKTTGLYVNIVESSEHKKDVILGNTAEAFTFTSSGSSYTIKNISGDYIGKYTNNTWNMDSRTAENWTIIDAGNGEIKLSCDKGQIGLDNYTVDSPFYRNKSEGCTFVVEEMQEEAPETYLYTINFVASNGNKYMLSVNENTGALETTAYTGTPSAAQLFQFNHWSNGKYSILHGDKYLGYNRLDSEFNKLLNFWEVLPLEGVSNSNISGTVPAGSVYLKVGQRSSTSSMIGVLIVSNTTGAMTSSTAPFFNSSYTSAILLEAVELQTQDYTLRVTGAPEGTVVSYKGEPYEDGDVITITGIPSVRDFTPAVIDHYDSSISIDNESKTITVTYTRVVAFSGRTDYTIQQPNEGYFAIAGMAQNGVTTNFLYDNSGQVLAKSFVESEQDMYWRAESVGNGMYTFKNVGTGKYLNIASANDQPITTSDTPQSLYFVISASVACIHNGSTAIDVAYAGTSPVAWSGTVPEGSRRLLIYEAIPDDPDITYTYTVSMPNAPEGAKLTYGGVDYRDGDEITTSAPISRRDITVVKVPDYWASIQIVGRTIEVVYVYDPVYNLGVSGIPTQVRYWFDTDGELHTSDYAAGAISIDASSLEMGIHALYYQVVDDKGQLSPVRFATFYRLPADEAESLGVSGTPTQVRYWFDTDGELHTSDYAAGAVSIDASSLEMGIHALYYQVVDSKGQLSPVRFANFYRLPAEDAEDLGLSGTPTQVRYWFDTDGELHTSDYAAGAVSIDASSLEMGIHALYYQVVDSKGQLSPVRFATFYRLPAEDAENLGLSGTPTQVRYWADTDHEHMQQTAYVAGHTIINLSMYGEGEPGEQHTLHYQVVDDKGNISPVRSISYIYDKHQQVIVLEEWEVLKRFHDASVQQGEWTRNAWTMTEGRGETADESLERLPGVSLVDGHVRSIDLSQSGVTGNVSSLAELPELEHLNLSGNAIANVELPLIPETATANLRNQSLTDTKNIVWDTPTEQSLTEDLPNIVRLSADARSLAEQYTWTLWNAPSATGWRMSLVMKDAMPELRQVSSRIYDNANGGTVTLQVATGIAAGTTLPVQFHYLEGDANLSGAVDVLDVQTVVNESFGIGTGLLNKQAADLQADGSLNVLDLVRVVNVLLAQAMPSSEAATRHMAKAAAQHEGHVFLECTDGSLLLESSECVGALDLWLRLPQGSTENDVENLLAGFDAAMRLSGNLCHVVLYSPMGMEMDGMGEALLRLPQGTTLLRASAADAEANSLSVSMGQTTGIVDATASREVATAYDLQGRLSIARGLHITRQRGKYAKSLTK